MISSQPDVRSEQRKTLDEQIAAEPKLAFPNLTSGSQPRAMEEFLQHHRRPLAVVGVVENGLVRPLDPQVKLPENSRVIIVASDISATKPSQTNR
jgi:hypothetical protein